MFYWNMHKNGKSTGMVEFYFKSSCIIFSDEQLAILVITNPLQVCFCEFSEKYNNHLILFSYFKNSISFKQVGFPSYFLISFRSSIRKFSWKGFCGVTGGSEVFPVTSQTFKAATWKLIFGIKTKLEKNNEIFNWKQKCNLDGTWRLVLSC